MSTIDELESWICIEQTGLRSRELGWEVLVGEVPVLDQLQAAVRFLLR